jgi:O-antigen/teichoic acid export membrane protein
VVLAAPKALGDILYVTLWPLGTPLLVAERLRVFIAMNLVGNVLLVVGSAVLFPMMGLVGIGWAYVFAMAMWLACYLVDQHTHGFRLSRTTKVLFVVGSSFLTALALLPVDATWRAVIGGALLLAWCACTWKVGLGGIVRGLLARRSLRLGMPA